MPGTERGDEVELFSEGFKEIGGGITVVVVAITPLGHLDHEVFVEVLSEAIGRGGNAPFSGLRAECGDAFGFRDLANIGVPVREQDHPRKCRLTGPRQQGLAAGLPTAVKIGRSTTTDMGKCHQERLTVADRPCRNQRLDAIVEDHQRGDIGRFQALGDVFRATHGLQQRRAGHRTGPVDDQRQVIGLAHIALAGLRGVRCLYADQDGEFLGDTGDQCRLEWLDENAGNVVIGHMASCSSGTIAGR